MCSSLSIRRGRTKEYDVDEEDLGQFLGPHGGGEEDVSGQDLVERGQKHQDEQRPVEAVNPFFHVRFLRRQPRPANTPGRGCVSGCSWAEDYLMSRTLLEQAGLEHFLVQLVHGRRHRLGKSRLVHLDQGHAAFLLEFGGIILVGGHGHLVGVLGGVFPGLDDEILMVLLQRVEPLHGDLVLAGRIDVLGPHHVLLGLVELEGPDRLRRVLLGVHDAGLQGHVDFLEGDRGGQGAQRLPDFHPGHDLRQAELETLDVGRGLDGPVGGQEAGAAIDDAHGLDALLLQRHVVDVRPERAVPELPEVVNSPS